MARTGMVAVRLEPQLKRQLEALAARRDTSVSRLVVRAVRQLLLEQEAQDEQQRTDTV